METKEQKIERLKKGYWILAEMINERFERAIKIEERIRHLREIQIKVGDMYCHTDKSFPNTIQIAETELEEVNKQRFQLFDKKLKLEQKIKELEDEIHND